MLLVPLLQFAAMPRTEADPGPGDVDEAAEAIDATEADLSLVQARLADAGEELADIQRRFAQAETEARRLGRLILEDEAVVVAMARAIYKDGSAGALLTVLSSESLVELESRVEYLQSAQKAHSRDLEQLVVHRVELEGQLDRLAAARSEAEALVQEMVSLREGLEARAAAQRQELSGLQDAIARQRAQQEAAEADAAAAQATQIADAATSAPATYDGGSVNWDAIAQCESGGNWHLDGVYDGGLQFHPATWLGYGGGEYAEYAWQASRVEQISIGERVLAAQGPSAWPHCFQYG
jgi:peptidoglycan hydrolase CwlO-like protein